MRFRIHSSDLFLNLSARFGMLALAVILLAISTGATLGQTISITTLGSAYTQNFDTLANSGTSSVVPNGWAFLEAGTSANTLYTAGNGGGTSGDTYSFGATGSADRAFGGIQSNNLIPTIGAAFTSRRTLGPVEARLLATVGMTLLLVALLFAFFPRLLAYPVVAMFAWMAAALLHRAYKLHREQAPKGE